MANKTTLLQNVSADDYKAFPHSFWQQTHDYGAIQERSGRKVVRRVIKESDTVLGYFTLVIYPFFGSYSFGYMPYGPIMLETLSPDQINQYEKELRDLAHEHRLVFVRHDTDCRSDSTNISLGTPVPPFLQHSSFHQPRGEGILNIAPELDQIKANFSKSTKRNVNRSLKQDLKIEFHYGSDMYSSKDSFIALNEANIRSHGTTTHSDSYFRSLFEVLAKSENNFVANVYHDDILVASHIICTWFDGSIKLAYCPFGASSDTGKDVYAYYFLKYKTIEHLQSFGVAQWNWGGISISDTDSHLKGVDQFKRGFGIRAHEHSLLRDSVYKKLLYKIYVLKKTIRDRVWTN